MISIVIPAFNEEENIMMISEKVIEQLNISRDDWEVIVVDDGSHDKTAEKVKELHERDSRIKLVSLSRNFGHQKALKAGIDHSSGDCVICMDADMQHPPKLIPKLLEKWREGFDVVYTIRKETKGASIFKRVTSGLFYWLIDWLAEINIKSGATDFRLMDQKVINVLKRMGENFLFIRGLASWVGFRQTGVDYIAESRQGGVSKYPLRKMLKLAWDGITSFSILPLRFAVSTGAIISILSFSYAAYALVVKVFCNRVVPGWSSLLISVLFLGGIQLLCIGILGEYLGKMFIESKRRPVYIVKEKLL